MCMYLRRDVPFVCAYRGEVQRWQGKVQQHRGHNGTAQTTNTHSQNNNTTAPPPSSSSHRQQRAQGRANMQTVRGRLARGAGAAGSPCRQACRRACGAHGKHGRHGIVRMRCCSPPRLARSAAGIAGSLACWPAAQAPCHWSVAGPARCCTALPRPRTVHACLH